MAALVITVVVLSGALGLLAQCRLARRERTDGQDAAEGIPLTDLLAPVRILVALVLAFVLVQTFSSYEDASDAAEDEAGAVATEAVAAALLPSPTGPELVGLLRCYARAVAGPGWASLEETRRTSSISSDADARVAAAVARAQQGGISETLVGEVVTAERDRVAARRDRLAEAAPSVPAIVTALLVGCVAITVASTAAFAGRRIRPSLRWALLGLTALIFTASLLVILDLDRPFGGVARIDPTAIRSVEEQLGTLPAGADPPCDRSGESLTGD
ncbi:MULTISPECIES: bestrophin-like domain [unclassified Blastococcus]